jgi:hypothetical protein
MIVDAGCDARKGRSHTAAEQTRDGCESRDHKRSLTRNGVSYVGDRVDI